MEGESIRAASPKWINIDGETGEITLLRTEGLAMGVMEGADMEEREIVLSEGDTVPFYTDGVIEATGESLDQFGIERLLSVMRENSHLPAEDLVEKIVGEVLAFSGAAPQFDDITLIALKSGGAWYILHQNSDRRPQIRTSRGKERPDDGHKPQLIPGSEGRPQRDLRIETVGPEQDGRRLKDRRN